MLRALMIFAGAAMLGRFHWLVYVFGAFLVVTGFRLFLESGREPHPERSWPMRLARRVVPSTSRLDGERFFAVENGRRVATSIPAIFAITEDPFIVFTSNIFAILGLRSLDFLLAGLLDRFRYLKLGLAAVLVFVGAKLVAIDFVKLPPLVSLAMIALLLGGAVAVSWLHARREAGARRARLAPAPGRGAARADGAASDGCAIG